MWITKESFENGNEKGWFMVGCKLILKCVER